MSFLKTHLRWGDWRFAKVLNSQAVRELSLISEIESQETCWVAVRPGAVYSAVTEELLANAFRRISEVHIVNTGGCLWYESFLKVLGRKWKSCKDCLSLNSNLCDGDTMTPQSHCSGQYTMMILHTMMILLMIWTILMDTMRRQKWQYMGNHRKFRLWFLEHK